MIATELETLFAFNILTNPSSDLRHIRLATELEFLEIKGSITVEDGIDWIKFYEKNKTEALTILEEMIYMTQN